MWGPMASDSAARPGEALGFMGTEVLQFGVCLKKRNEKKTLLL